MKKLFITCAVCMPLLLSGCATNQLAGAVDSLSTAGKQATQIAPQAASTAASAVSSALNAAAAICQFAIGTLQFIGDVKSVF